MQIHIVYQLQPFLYLLIRKYTKYMFIHINGPCGHFYSNTANVGTIGEVYSLMIYSKLTNQLWPQGSTYGVLSELEETNERYSRFVLQFDAFWYESIEANGIFYYELQGSNGIVDQGILKIVNNVSPDEARRYISDNDSMESIVYLQ
jgi:hypothetical protein